METPNQKIERLEREKRALEYDIESRKQHSQGFIGAMIVCGLFLLLTLGFGCQIGGSSGRY
jgi:hypothetical protein